MDFPFPNNAPADAGAPTDDFWAFNPQQPPPMNAQADDTSLDELLALYQTAQDAPPAPFAPTGEPESYPAFGAEPAAGGMEFPAFDAAGAAFDAGAAFGDPATDAPFPAFGAETDNFGGFGADAPAFPAFDAPAADAGGFGGFETVVPEAPAAFGAEPAPFDSSVPAFDASAPFDSAVPDFGAPAGDAFPAFEAPAADAGLGDLSGGPVFDAFPAFEAADAAAEAPAELPADFGADMGAAFPAFGEETAAPAAGAMEFSAFDAEPAELPADFGADMGAAFPAFDAAPAAELGDLSGGPVFDAFPAAEETTFPAFDAAPAAEPVAMPAPEPAAPAGGFLFSEEEPQEFVPDEEMTAFPALDDAPVFPAFDAAPAAEVAPTPAPEPVAEQMGLAEPEEPAELPADFGMDLGTAFPAFEEPAAPAAEETVFPAFEAAGAAIDDTPPVFAAPEPVVEKAAPVVPAVDPEQTLRYREVPAAPAAAGPQLDLAALASLTGKEVVVKTADDRRVANQQLTQVVGALSTGLDDIQGRMAHLYADLQKAAVSRAPVDEIQQITMDLAKAKASVGEGSELYKQALFLRQMADAYLQMLKEL